jgi:hypothetical protein
MRRELVALGVVVLLALLLWWQLRREPPERAPVEREEVLPADASRRSPAEAKADASEPPPPPGHIEGEPRLLLSGRIVHADGRPAAGAEVSTGWAGSAIPTKGEGRWLWRTTTEKDGRYRFYVTEQRRDLPRSLDVRARLGDRVAMPEAVKDLEAPLVMEDLVLEDGRAVSVRVRDGAGAPVAGAHAMLAAFRDGVTEHRRLVATSDDTGLMVFFPLRKSAPWSLRLTVTHPNHPETETKLPFTDRIEEVVLPVGVEARGRVTDPDGKPRSGVYIVAATQGKEALNAHWNLQAVTNAEGAFVIRGIPAGEGRLLLYPGLSRNASSYSTAQKIPWLSEPFMGTEGGVLDVGTIVLHAAGTIRGRVLEVDGTPVPSASVGLRGAFQGLSGPWVLTKDDGSFALKDIPPGEYAVRASKSRGEKGAFEGEAAGARPDGPEVVVRLKIKPGIVLRFFSKANPTERVSTKALSYKCQRSPHEMGGHGGIRAAAPMTWYRLDCEPGAWYVRVRVPGYAEADLGRVVLPEDKDLVLDVYLRKTD